MTGSGSVSNWHRSWLRPIPFCGLLAVAAWAVWATVYYGRIGFMSLDMPITWDTAWRMMHGQVPFRDFNTPGDVVPALIQIAFFKVGGLSWWGYLVHAGLCNAAFALGVTLFLSRMGASVWTALFAGALEGWHFNTPIGIPYYDQYSYFFAFFALAATALGVLEEKAAARAFWLACVPPLCAVTVLSKVSPGLYALALLPGVFLLGARRGEWRAACGVLAASALVTGAVLALVCVVEGLTFSRMWESLFGLPSGIGHERWAGLKRAEVLREIDWHVRRFRVVVLALGFAAAAFALSFRLPPERRSLAAPIRVLAWIALAAPFVDLAAVLLANQEALNYLAYGVLSVGAAVAALGLARPALGPAALAVAVALVLAVDFSTGWRITHRAVNNLELDRHARWDAYPRAGRELAPMIWINSLGGYSRDDFWALVDSLRARNEPFLIAGQNTLPYSLCGRSNPFPAAWFHHGLTFPKAADPRRAAFDAWAIRDLKAAGIRWVAVDPTWGDWLAEFPWLREWTEKPTGPEIDFGTWRLIPVDPALLP
ncbi:MAG TPA: hypothetical protein VIM58_05625 [Candidatus Methylacidiphilales bacterium]